MRKILDKCNTENMLTPVLMIFAVFMIMCVLMGAHEARAQDAVIYDLQNENETLIATVSENNALIYELRQEIKELESMQELTVKTYDDREKIYNQEINRLEKKLKKLKAKKSKYKVAKKYLSKDERFLVNYISKGGTIEDAGTWYCTAYCTEKRRHICGTGTGVTASGEPVEAFVSCALNRHNLKAYPFGTHIYIEGVGERVVMDTGGGVRQKQIDCAVDTHYSAVHWSGQGDHRVWILKNG